MTVRPTKTQISLGNHPDWSESLLCAQWVAKYLSFLPADSEDPDQPGHPRWARSHFVGFVMRWLKWLITQKWLSLWYTRKDMTHRLDLDWLMFWFLISKCLTVIEVLVNFGTEQGPACWEVCHCEGWSKSWCTYAIIVFFSIREWIDFWFSILKNYWLLLRWSWSVNFLLTDAKRRSVWTVYCSITLHVHWNKR